MNAKGGLFLAGALALLGSAAARNQQIGQPPDSARTPGLQSPADPNLGAFLAANCKSPPVMPPARRSGGAQVTSPTLLDVSSTEIPGVIAAGQRWKVLVDQSEGSADGIVAFDDGSVWIAEPTKSDVLRVDKNGTASIVYTDTYTGGALAANRKGQVFVAERALHNAIWMLEPQRRLFANSFNGEPLDCIAANINDLEADSRGGVYMTISGGGGVYYANSKGQISGRFGTIGGNGLILSRDEKTLYVTGKVGDASGVRNGDGLVAFDVQRGGSLTRERQFAEICGDGSAIDAAGRIYCTAARLPDPADPTKMIAGIGVVSPEGHVLGLIPQPLGLQSIAFGGLDKKTLFAVAGGRGIHLMSIQLIAQGNKKRPK